LDEQGRAKKPAIDTNEYPTSDRCTACHAPNKSPKLPRRMELHHHAAKAQIVKVILARALRLRQDKTFLIQHIRSVKLRARQGPTCRSFC
jgi:hypothetical protein